MLFIRCNSDGDPELIKLQLTPQGATDSLYFILRFVDGQVNVESIDAPADARKKLNAKVGYLNYLKFDLLQVFALI